MLFRRHWIVRRRSRRTSWRRLLWRGSSPSASTCRQSLTCCHLTTSVSCRAFKTASRVPTSAPSLVHRTCRSGVYYLGTFPSWTASLVHEFTTSYSTPWIWCFNEPYLFVLDRFCVLCVVMNSSIPDVCCIDLCSFYFFVCTSHCILNLSSTVFFNKLEFELTSIDHSVVYHISVYRIK